MLMLKSIKDHDDEWCEYLENYTSWLLQLGEENLLKVSGAPYDDYIEVPPN